MRHDVRCSCVNLLVPAGGCSSALFHIGASVCVVYQCASLPVDCRAADIRQCGGVASQGQVVMREETEKCTTHNII